MSQNPQSQSGQKKQRPVDILRERRGGISDSMKTFVKEQNRTKKGIREALKTGPKTIPEISAACGIESHVVLWHLMAMKRYGAVVEDGESNGYVLYILKEA